MNYVTIDIKNPDDSLFLTVSVTKECEHVQELMTADYVQLSWGSVDYAVIPAGSYIEHEGVQMRLLEPYFPTIKSDEEWEYKPQFHGIVGQLKKLPFMFVNDESGTPTTLEPDFELTGNIAQFLDIVRGVFWKFVPNGYNTDFNYSIEITKSVYLEFQHVDIFSALNMIAKEFETEWFFDNWENTLTFGKAEFTDKNRVPLQVGINVGLPSVTKNSDEYYNTFYVFGSTRNIQQDYQGNNINSIVNKRLTLPSRYKDSCYETDENLNVGERYSTPLIFDDVYPRATEGGDSRGIKIENVRARILYKIDEETGDKIQIGTNSSGPIYETYTKYYFRIPEDKLNLTEDDIFPDAELKCSFETGSLAGYEFSLKAFFEETRLDTAEGQPLTVYKGDFEIQYIEEGNVIIPNQTSFAPREGDEVAFFNIKLPNEYVLNAQNQLLQRTIEEVERRKTNYNVYQVSSNPVAFAEADPILRVGSPVLYVDDTTTLETRVTKIVKKLDYSFEQTITVGNKKYQGTISQLKEEIQLVSTNQRVIEATSKMTEEMLQAYKRTQDAILQGFERIKNMWQWDGEDTIYTTFNVWTKGYISTKGMSDSSGEGGGGVDLTTMWDSLRENNALNVIHISHIPTLSTTKIADFASSVQALLPNVPTNVSELVNDAGYITASAIINKADKATTLAGYGITDAVTLNTEQTITRVKTFTNGIKTSIIVNQTSDNALFIGATDNYYCDLNTQLSSGHSAIIPFFQKIGSATSTIGDFGSARKGVIRLSGNASESQLLFDHYNATIHYRGSTSNGAFTKWKRIAFTDGLVANATNADNAIWLIPNSGLAYGNSGLQYFNLNGTQGTITNANVTPNAGWYHIIRQNHANSLGFFSDIATPLNYAEMKYGLYWRAVSNGINYGWYNLLDSNNYSNYAVTLGTEQTITGTKIFTSQLKSNMATGTAPLVVNSTTMVANLNANYLGGFASDRILTTHNGASHNLAESFTEKSGGSYVMRIGGGNAPTTNSKYGNILHVEGLWSDTSWELLAGWYNNELLFRSGNTNADGNGIISKGWKSIPLLTDDTFSPSSGTFNVNSYISVSNSLFCANGEISLGTDGLNISPTYAYMNIGNYLTVNGGATEIHGDYFRIGAVSTIFTNSVNINGNVNLSSMMMTNNDNGVLTLDGNYIDVNAPMNVKATMKIGNATLSYDYASGMLLIDKGIASSGAISTKGISNASAGIASAQFGLIYEDYWRMATNSELSSYGATATLFSGDNATNNGTIVIACDAFNNKTIADVDVFVVGYGEAPSSAMALVSYKIDGNKCYFRLNATQISGFTGFKIKVY